MFLPLQWRITPAVSGMYLAWEIASGRSPADPRFLSAVRQPLDRLLALLPQPNARQPQFWKQAIAVATRLDASGQDITVSLENQSGQEAQGKPDQDQATRELLRTLRQWLAAFQQAFPRLQDELTLRAGPLRELWEARGPGLFRRAASLVPDLAAPSSAVIELLPPVRGGGGFAFQNKGFIGIEALLFNPHSPLPEACRLGWLLLQLCLPPCPRDSGAIERELDACERLAAIPLVITAAEHVEWCTLNVETLRLAVANWTALDDTNPCGPHPEADLAPLLLRWWNDQQQSGRSWSAGVMTLAEQIARR